MEGQIQGCAARAKISPLARKQTTKFSPQRLRRPWQRQRHQKWLSQHYKYIHTYIHMYVEIHIQLGRARPTCRYIQDTYTYANRRKFSWMKVPRSQVSKNERRKKEERSETAKQGGVEGGQVTRNLCLTHAQSLKKIIYTIFKKYILHIRYILDLNS